MTKVSLREIEEQLSESNLIVGLLESDALNREHREFDYEPPLDYQPLYDDDLYDWRNEDLYGDLYDDCPDDFY